MKGLSNYEIAEMMKGVKNFRGVFAIDLLPKKIKPNESGIINFQKSTEEGSHWVSYFNKAGEKYVHYYDSFGLQPPELIRKYLEISGKKILYNSTQYQKKDSTLCAFYCMNFILRRTKGEIYYDIVYSFDQKPSNYNELSTLLDFV